MDREGARAGQNRSERKVEGNSSSCSQFDPTLFKMRDGVLMYTKSANGIQTGEVGRICYSSTRLWVLLISDIYIIGVYIGLYAMYILFGIYPFLYISLILSED